VLQLKLRLAAEPELGGYHVTIELSEVEVTVDVADQDLRRAVRTAADKCAEALRDRGFNVTTAEVLAALEDALEHSELVRASEADKLN
jgi:formyltetrahydrofolate synthetase